MSINVEMGGPVDWSPPTYEELRAQSGSGTAASCLDVRAVDGRNLVNGQNLAGHRRNLIDPGTCDVPKGQTITLNEWRSQQQGRSAS